MTLLHRPVAAGAVAVLGVAMAAATCSLGAGTAATAASTSAPGFSALAHSVPATTDPMTGGYRSSRMTVEVALTPRDNAQLTRTLRSIYTEGSRDYGHWLSRGQFDARYAPPVAERRNVASFLRGAGLRVISAPSPFLVRATGSSAQVSAAFRTTLTTYRAHDGQSYFQNSAAVQVPASMAGYVQGVIGLTNTVRDHDQARRAPSGKAGRHSQRVRADTGCEQPYPTATQLFDEVNDGIPIPFGYGGGPGCQGLTPAQVNSIYGAPAVGPRGQGKGVSIGVFELSEYQESDIGTWAQTFYGAGYTPPLENVTVDGGPGSPACPNGDECPPSANGYAGDIQVDADIETQLTIAPAVSHLIVYEAPSDLTGQTALDEWTAIAKADQATSISSSWGSCENDVPAAYVQAENTVFEQMAFQGQSVFGAEADTGAFGCIRSDGTTITNVLDPASQPWVTSVGGTSFENFNPGTNPAPAYPAAGTETVWNTGNLCNTSADEGNFPGYFWCAETGAGGGGSSQYWGRPFYQTGPGVNNADTTYGNGTTQCSLAAEGKPCREVPDVSADADEFTPYAEYCTGNASTPFSDCGGFSGYQNPPGWFGEGGTEMSAPLWAGIIADRDSFHGFRSGNINALLYRLLETNPRLYFHDITGTGQTPNTNGLFPATPGYDEATGIGTPKMAQLITLGL